MTCSDYVAAQNRYCEQRMAPLDIVAQNVVRRIQVARSGKRHVRADTHGWLLVLHPHPGRASSMPCNAVCRFAARTIGIRRPVEAGVPTRRRTGGVRHQRRGARPRFLPHRRHGHFQGRPLDAVRHRHERRRTLRFPHPRSWRPATSWRSVFEGIGGACFTPDAQWVFYVLLDDAWRPYAVMRHRVGTPVTDDVEVYREAG